MIEKKYWLTEEQILFIEKLMDKIDSGWSIYSYSTHRGLEDILDMGYYKDNQREWLQNMRMDYVETYLTN